MSYSSLKEAAKKALLVTGIAAVSSVSFDAHAQSAVCETAATVAGAAVGAMANKRAGGDHPVTRSIGGGIFGAVLGHALCGNMSAGAPGYTAASAPSQTGYPGGIMPVGYETSSLRQMTSSEAGLLEELYGFYTEAKESYVLESLKTSTLENWSMQKEAMQGRSAYLEQRNTELSAKRWFFRSAEQFINAERELSLNGVDTQYWGNHAAAAAIPTHDITMETMQSVKNKHRITIHCEMDPELKHESCTVRSSLRM